MVDMTPGAVTARLREAARLLRERGFVAKGVDMTSDAVNARLRVQGALSDMCRRLGKIGDLRQDLRSTAAASGRSRTR